MNQWINQLTEYFYNGISAVKKWQCKEIKWSKYDFNWTYLIFSAYTHTVMQHSANHINPIWRQDAELAKALMTGFAVALGRDENLISQNKT